VAACSPLESELTWAKEKLGISHRYRDYEALLAHDRLDAVFLVTATTLAVEVAAGAITGT
jgi:myo-inositol 2-dehydrogenase / D-chiro-inositol 1-dehydrogenase